MSGKRRGKKRQRPQGEVNAPARKTPASSGLSRGEEEQGTLFPDLRRTNLELLSIEATQFRGPLPPPEMLADYDRAVAGLSTEIVEYWKGEQQHRWSMDRRYANLDAAGLACGTVVALACILGGFHAIVHGAEAAGVAAVLAPIAAIVGAFVVVNRRRQETKGKEPADEGDPVTA